MGEHIIHRSRARRAVTAGLLGAGAVLVLSSCSSFGLAASSQSEPTSSATVVDPSVAQSSDAPTPTDTASTPAAGDSPTPTPVATTTPPATAVTPFITLATASGEGIRVSALVPKIVEQGGTCTLVATMGSVSRQTQSAAAPASSYTGCNPLVIPASSLAKGEWTVTVSYRSATSAGTSKSDTVRVG